MTLKIVGLGLMVAASSLAVPERASAGVHVDVGIALGRPAYVSGYGPRDAGRYGYERGYREGANHHVGDDSFAAAYMAARLTGDGPAAAASAAHRLAGKVIQHRGAIMPRTAGAVH